MNGVSKTIVWVAIAVLAATVAGPAAYAQSSCPPTATGGTPSSPKGVTVPAGNVTFTWAPGNLTKEVSYEVRFDRAGIDPRELRQVACGNVTTSTTCNFTMPAGDWDWVVETTSGTCTILSNPARFTASASCPSIVIGPLTLTDGTVGTSYEQDTAFSTKGGADPITWSVVEPKFAPPGLVIERDRFTGTPTRDGRYTFTIQATDANGCSATREYTVTISCPPMLLSSLVDGLVGAAYTRTLDTKGGTGPYTYALISGTLPAGLTLTGDTVSGTPQTAGTSTFTIRSTDSLGCAITRDYTVKICPVITVAPGFLPGATVGSAFSTTLTASGGTGPYTFAVTTGALPAGLTLQGATISGTPTTAGTFDFGVTVTDTAHACTRGIGYRIVVCPQIQVGPATLSDAVLGSAYSATFSAFGGTAPHTFAVTGGVPPKGLTLSGATLSGTPEAVQTAKFEITATDANGCRGSIVYDLRVVEGCPTILISPSTLPNATVRVPYNATLSATGGTAPHEFVVTRGELPPGLFLERNLITGNPERLGTFEFTLGVTDARRCTGSQDFRIVVGEVPCESGVATPIAPANESTVTPDVAFSWNAAKGSTNHELLLSSDGGKTFAIAATTTGTTARLELKAAKYAWFIRTHFGGSCQPTDSQTFIFTVEVPPTCPPNAPSLLAPADGASVPAGNVTFSWSAVTSASGYDLFAGFDGATPTVHGSSTTTSMTRVIDGGMTVEWYVVVKGVPGCRTFESTHGRFSTQANRECPNTPPQLLEPVRAKIPTGVITLKWNGVANATSYEVFVGAAGKLPGSVSSTPGTSMNITVKEATTIEWFVRAGALNCKPIDSEHTTFTTVDACSNGTPSLGEPAEGASVPPQTTFSWNGVANATLYKVFVVPPRSLNAPTLVGTTTSTRLSVTSLPVGDLIWFVHATFDGCPFTESARNNFKVVGAAGCPSDRPTLVSPGNGARIENPFNFVWNPVKGAKTYRLSVAIDGGDPTPIAIVPDTFYEAKLPGKSIEWFVDAVLDGCPSTQSEHFTFSLGVEGDCPTSPAAPQLIGPANGAIDQASPINLEWSAVPGAINYTVHASINGSALSPLATVTDTRYSAELPAGKVLWQVSANFRGCPATISSRGAFSIAAGFACSGSPTTLIAPANGAQVSSEQEFHWNEVRNAVGYEVFVALGDSTRFESLGTTTDTFLKKTLPPGNVQWFVNTLFAGCPDQRSATFRFTVASELRCAGGVISLRQPQNGATLGSTVNFEWTGVADAIAYRVWASANGDAFEVVAKTSTTTSASASLPSGDIAWYVEGIPSLCPSIISPTGKFTIGKAATCDANQPVTLVSPVGSAASPASVSGPVSFLFNPAPNASAYRIWLLNSRNRAFEDIATVNAAAFGNSTVTRDLPAGDFTWYVETLYPGCPPVESARAFFRVAATESICRMSTPSIISPANGSRVSSPVTFLWSDVPDVGEYRLYVSLNGSDPVVLETTTDTSVTKPLPPGEVVWFIEAVFKACPSTRSDKAQFTIAQNNVCSSDAPGLLSPIDGAQNLSTEVDFAWSAVSSAVRYVLFAQSGDDAPTSLGETDLTRLSRMVPAGARIEWFVVAFFDGCKATESQHFTFTTPPTCDNRRPLLLTPDESAFNVPSSTYFSWTQVPKAISYNLWVATGTDEFNLLGSGPETQRTVSLPSGLTRWFVEAIFSDCPGTQSATSRFIVAPPPVACALPDRVLATVPGQVLTATVYNVRWNPVLSSTKYEVQEATSADFSDAITHVIDGVVVPRTQEVSGSPKQFFYRVRAISNCSDQRGPYSEAISIFVTPVLQSNGGAEIGFNDNVIQTIFLPGSSTPVTFIATVDKPWLTVTPASGELPAEGLTLKVTADPDFLVLGTNSGTVSIIYAEVGQSSRFETNAAPPPSKSTISVSLVTPVGAGGKNGPPPDSLIIPAIAHLAGLNNSAFESDVRLANLSAQTMRYQLNFTPTREDSTQKGSSTIVQVEPGATMALDDILETFFGTGGTFALGSLEIRPLTTSSSSFGTSAANARTTIASSKTFNVTPSGTFGQYIPALAYSQFVGRATGSVKNVLSLQQVAQSSAFRTNFGLVEASGEAADVIIRVFNNAGDVLAEIPDRLKAGEHKQTNLLAENNIGLEDGRIEVEVVSPTGRVTAYASTVDNKTNDPLLISPTLKSAVSAKRYVLPGVALFNNGFADFRTDARFFNAGASSTRATVTYYPQIASEQVQTRDLQFAPGEVKALDNVLSSLFGLSTTLGGVLAITTDNDSNLVTTARTYNQTNNGTFGQFVPGVTPAESAALGGRALNLLQLEQSSRFRSNIGVAETSGKPVRFEISAYLPDSKVIPRIQLDMPANGFMQRSLADMFGLRDTYNARVTVKVVGGSGTITAYASVIDQVTNDPTYVPAQ